MRLAWWLWCNPGVRGLRKPGQWLEDRCGELMGRGEAGGTEGLKDTAQPCACVMLGQFQDCSVAEEGERWLLEGAT